LRKTADAYLGKVDFQGKRVIEIGPASGFLSLYMEQHGAQVTAIEPPMEIFWDLVPRAGVDLAQKEKEFSRHIERIRNSFWYLHQAFQSKVELYEADAYRLPESLGSFDTAVLACVLLHTSAPARLLASVAGLGVKEIIITEISDAELGEQPVCRLLPSGANDVTDAWWSFSPAFFTQYLEVMGFRKRKVTQHRQLYRATGRLVDLFTVVGSDRK
jgi:hypothetical protein